MSQTARRLVMVIGVGFLTPFSALAQSPSPADPQLPAAYARAHFDRLYPPEAVAFIKEQLQTANPFLPVLAQLAKDPRPEVRKLVAVLLGESAQAEAAPPLWQLVRDDQEPVRLTAAGALTRLSQTVAIGVETDGLRDPRAPVRRFVAAALNMLGDKAAEESLIAALSTEENELVRLDLVRALGRCGTKAATPVLIKTVRDDPSVLVRTTAVPVLAMHASAQVTETLLAALQDPDWHVRAIAALVLRGRAKESSEVATALLDRLYHDDFALVRDRAADSLAGALSNEVLKGLVAAIVSDNREAGIHAARGLIYAKAVAAVPLLLEHRNDPRPEVRRRIVEVIGALGGANHAATMIELSGDPDPNVRLGAVNALRGLGPDLTLEILLPRLGDTNSHVRAAAARILGERGDRAAVPHLVRLLRFDSETFVRSEAAEALGKLGDKSATLALIEVLVGDGTRTAPAPGEGLTIGGGIEMLPEVASLTELERRIKAVQALGELRDERAVDPIIQKGLAAEDAGLRAESAVALGKIGSPRATPALQLSVKPYYDTAPKVTDTILIAAGTVDDRVRVVQEREARVRASVAWALGQIGDPQARALLTMALDDVNSLVRDAAAEALARIAEKEERKPVASSTPPTSPPPRKN